jgi:hypothetical protein
MNRSYAAFGIAAFALIASARFGLALAAPPTVVPSPGYDARLQEQRKAAASTPVVQAPGPGPVERPPARHRHHRAH